MDFPSLDWARPPGDSHLPPDAVHVWRIALDPPPEHLPALAATLAPDEHRRATAFRFADDARRFIVGRGALRALLARYLGLPPDRVAFTYGPYGKPQLAGPGPPPPPLCFNLAHSGELAVCAATWAREIGVDIEQQRPLGDFWGIAAHFFAPGEVARLQALAPEQQMRGFYQCWTRKEALLKAQGLGLQQPLAEVEVAFGPEEPARLLRLAGDPQAAARWALQDLPPAPDYSGALAVMGHDWRLSCWEWSIDQG